MKTVFFKLHLSKDECYKIYNGSTHYIRIRGSDDKVYQLPATNFRKFITHQGIYGEFKLEFNENNKFIALDKA